MTNNWFKDMEKITICLGFAIVYLGVNNFYGDSIISPALVTGISLSGLCLTMADFSSKQFKGCKNKWGIHALSFIDFLLYCLAALCIIGYPNSTFIKSLDKDTLDWLSTSASVIALGFVFIAIGISNKDAVLEEEKKRFEDEEKRFKEIEGMFNESKKISEQFRELVENRNEVIEKKDKQIKELEKKVKELEGKKTAASA
ncbi:hypothetical protein FOC75_00315 (plasmid) [Bacillus cereus]|uniref:hypothetical protein n=1 Tax=Bacillus cereus group TaxID=86661 RepID=UPI0005A35DBA|nr:hypothetical protein [Bacillus cereus]AJH60107.1 hypothetical protein BG11_5769 [Bacillus cereus]AJK31950.1 hypothetical protein BF33_5814 [Bacillus cereus]KWU56822.1 hypothetical protein AWW71_20250 [Bacillus cereus]KWW50571.1 hypothetical protein AWW69_14625 [Bacillus cereus]QKH64105.1 hypothetical protein FOC75_00315 [Bacillus cereus]